MNNTYEQIALKLLAFDRTDEVDLALHERAIRDACSNMKEGIEILSAMVELAKDDYELDSIAAGLMMELLSEHRTEALRELARIADSSTAMRRTLEMTWVDPQQDSYADIVTLGHELGFDLEAPRIVHSTVKIYRGRLPESEFD